MQTPAERHAAIDAEREDARTLLVRLADQSSPRERLLLHAAVEAMAPLPPRARHADIAELAHTLLVDTPLLTRGHDERALGRVIQGAIDQWMDKMRTSQASQAEPQATRVQCLRTRVAEGQTERQRVCMEHRWASYWTTADVEGCPHCGSETDARVIARYQHAIAEMWSDHVQMKKSVAHIHEYSVFHGIDSTWRCPCGAVVSHAEVADAAR